MYQDGVSSQIIIGFTGYAGVGKDTAALPLIDMLNFKRIAFADCVKNMLFNLNPIVPVQTERPMVDAQGIKVFGQTVSELSLTNVQFLVNQLGWDTAKEVPEVRRLLQRMATEGCRDLLGENIWVDVVEKQLPSHPLVVITDVRFPNEAAMIIKHGGFLIKLDREGVGPKNQHVSELLLDTIESHLAIRNDGDDVSAFHADIINALAALLETFRPKHNLRQKVRMLCK